MVERLFLAVPRDCLWFVIVVFPDHTHLLFFVKDFIILNQVVSEKTCMKNGHMFYIGVIRRKKLKI